MKNAPKGAFFMGYMLCELISPLRAACGQETLLCPRVKTVKTRIRRGLDRTGTCYLMLTVPRMVTPGSMTTAGG